MSRLYVYDIIYIYNILYIHYTYTAYYTTTCIIIIIIIITLRYTYASCFPAITSLRDVTVKKKKKSLWRWIIYCYEYIRVQHSLFSTTRRTGRRVCDVHKYVIKSAVARASPTACRRQNSTPEEITRTRRVGVFKTFPVYRRTDRKHFRANHENDLNAVYLRVQRVLVSWFCVEKRVDNCKNEKAHNIIITLFSWWKPDS